jgi:transposase-like protein
MGKLEFIKKVDVSETEALEKEYDAAWEKANELRKKLHNLKRQQALPVYLEGQFIKYEEDGYVHYVHVDWVYDSFRYENFDYKCTIRGFGFGGEFTGYYDATDWNWSYMYEFDIFSSEKEEFEKRIDSIQVIDENEFMSALEKMLKQVKTLSQERLAEKDEE